MDIYLVISSFQLKLFQDYEEIYFPTESFWVIGQTLLLFFVEKGNNLAVVI